MKPFNEYINSIRKRKIKHKIIDSTTVRIGRLKVESKPEVSKVQFLYNDIVIIPWEQINNDEDIRNLQKKALSMLKDVEINLQDFADVLINNYNNIIRRRKEVRHIYLKSVSIIELCNEIIGKKCKKNKNWAFIYNLDLYRHQLSLLPDEKRLFFETGSQSETEKMGVVLNGLDTNSIYKKFCYVSK